MLSPSTDPTDTRLEVATKKGDYDYWLTHEDIADIARLQYADYGTSNTADSYKAFEIIGSPAHLRNKLQTFITKANQIQYVRLSFIINIQQLHWTSLIVVSHHKNCAVFYIDSLRQALPSDYQAILEENNLHLAAINLNGYFRGQEDDYNCGLWALENAHDLTRMADEQKGILWISQQLQRPRSLDYFTRLRVLYSLNLEDDPVRKARVLPLDFQLPQPEQEADTRLSPIPISISDRDEFKPKRQKLSTESEKTRELFEFFVKKFIQDFAKRLGMHSLVAKGERLTAEGLKTELKLGATGALLGAAISQNIVGTIPSFVASLRIISSKYYTNKKMSQKITKVFSELKKDDLSKFLTEAAVEIFHSYEQQFMQITDKAGHKMAIEKLAEDAAGRALNYINEKLTSTTPLSSELIAFGIVSGKSETYFDPSLKKVRVRVTGSRIQDAEGNSLSTASFFERVGLVIKGKNTSPDMFYKKDVPQSTRYGYRRLLSEEKDSQGQLKEIYQASYMLDNQAGLTTYEYQLNSGSVHQEAKQIVEKIGRASNLIPPAREIASPKNILFNLRRSIKNFSGRTLALTTLHQLLGSGIKSAVVTQKMAQLSLNTVQQPLQEGMQTAVSGMGGIGKTQLALEYARQYAADYDHNVLWIEAEKKVDILDCFKKLARKLTIDLNDAYNNEKESSQLIEEVYAYFEHAKSLFIFDNVENVKEIEAILPKASSGNNPTVLITSRYSNWKNVATPLVLGVFTETESINFIKSELGLMDNAEETKIKELTKLLQNLPLALQQAVAYIKNEKNLDNGFTIEHYIDRFKQKSQELLAFDFSNYSNDPYSKTVLTTWKITLEKLAQEKLIGVKAIEILEIMAYLHPDNISNQIFIPLPGNQYLNAAIQLLKNYSLINEGTEPHISIIHRLVQKVLRINLEKNQLEFASIVKNIMFLTRDFVYDKEIMSHYYSFLLHMTQHEELTEALSLPATHKKILEVIVNFDDDKILMFNLFDLAQLTLARVQYLNFIGEALITYMRCPFIVSLTNVIEYIEKNVNERQLSLAEARHIIDLQFTPIATKLYKFGRFSSDPATHARQRNAIRLVDLLEAKIFSKEVKTLCPRTKKRSICSIAEDESLIQRPLDSLKIKTYVKKIGRVANVANLALLSKDTLSALIQGDFESVAITFTLLTSSRILGKISNKMLTKGGELLALGDEKLFQKEFDYDAKLALSLFSNKEIMLAGKARFLGSAMKAAAPFVARGSALFFAYNFVKGLNSNETDWVDNLSNGAIVAFDLGEAGVEAAEYLGYIAGVSEVTGPIGEGLGALVIGGMQLRHVKQELNAIEKWVRLSEREKFAEGMGAFFNFKPSEYLETKANNQQLANKAIDFLKLHPDIQRYVFSAWLPDAELPQKKFVFLDRKRNLTLLNTVPEELSEGHFFCLTGVRARPHSSSWIKEHLESFVESELLGLEEGVFYLCINTLGVEYNANRTGNATLIALQGNATVIGSNSDTIFLIGDGHQDYRAGDADDLFILQGTRITGRLQAGLGVNIVKFSEYQPAANESVLLDSQGFLCGKNVTTNSTEEFCDEGFQLSNVTQLHGRKKLQDKIFPIANTTLVDAYAGESAAKPDFIYITEKSAKNLNITVRPDTVVRLLPRNITGDNIVTYNIPADQIGSASIQLPFNDETIHQFHFESDLEDLNELSIKNNTISFQFTYPEGCFKLSIEATDAVNSNASTTEKAFFIQSASYIFNKNLGIKLFNEKTLYAQSYGNNSVEEIIQFAAPIAHRLDKAMLIQTPQNITLAIGGRQQEILSTDGLLINHLIGNAGDTVYVIQVPKNLTVPFPLNDISLYNLANDTLITSTITDTLDLHEVLKKAQNHCSAANILPTINETHEDLTLNLYTNYHFSASGCTPLAQTSYRIAQIILKKALINYWYQDLDIILDKHPMNIIFEEDNWKLVPIPLVFMGNKNIIVITDEDVKQKDEIFILKNSGKYDFKRHNDTDLLVTNLFNNITEAELYTVLFSNFFQNSLFKEKILTLSLSFFDESLILNKHTQEINNATDFYRQIQSYFNGTIDTFFNESGIFFDNITASAPRRRRDIATPLPTGSSSSRITPGVYDPFAYLHLKMMQFANFILKRFKPNNGFNLNDVEGKEFASRKNNWSTEISKKETSPPVYCNQKDFFTEEDCVKNQSDLGLLGYCANTNQVVVWFKKNTTEAGITSTLSWFAITYNGVSANPGNNHLNTSNISLSLRTDHLYFSNKDGCYQILNLNNVSNTSLATLFPYLPEEGKQWFLAQWSYEKKMHDKALQDEVAIELFKQHSEQIGLNYIGNAVLLHTFVGDYFQAMGFRPNWQQHDPSHFLARLLSAIQQQRSGGPNQTSTLAAALLETALLHPWIQQTDSFFLPNTKIRYKKQALRFCADLLQWGSLNFALMPSVLEMLFPDYLPIASITWGLRAVLSFYMVNNDPSYYYLGIALFFLPQLPSLLEHLGIPVTACVSKTLEKLAQLFIFQSLLELRPTPDESRLAQRNIELQTAEQRVIRGSLRVSAIVKPLGSFFKPAPKPCFNQQEDQPKYRCSAA